MGICRLKSVLVGELTGSLATVALVVTVFRLLLGIWKPADALMRVGATLGIVVALVLIPGVLANAWSGLPLWQRIALAAIGIGVWLWLRPQRQTRSKK